MTGVKSGALQIRGWDHYALAPVFLDEFVSSDITQEFLDNIRSDLETIRNAKFTTVTRILYVKEMPEVSIVLTYKKKFNLKYTVFTFLKLFLNLFKYYIFLNCSRICCNYPHIFPAIILVLFINTVCIVIIK